MYTAKFELRRFLIIGIVISFGIALSYFQISYSQLSTSTDQDNITYESKNNKSDIKFNNESVSISDLGNLFTKEMEGLNVALVQPVFTNAAYNHTFYKFFYKYANASSTANITTDLKLLSSEIPDKKIGTIPSVYNMAYLFDVIKSINNKIQIDVLTDIEVHKGNIFDTENNNLYHIIVLGHQEYVTQEEYDNLRKFVSNGGVIIMLDANVFYGEVKYHEDKNTISLVKGHNWAFNGQSAWKSVAERWANETSEWVGSNFYCFKCIPEFKNNPFDYSSFEEQNLTNTKNKILIDYEPTEFQNKKATVATYELQFGKGKAISMGIYSDVIIHNKEFQKFFSSLVIKYGNTL